MIKNIKKQISSSCFLFWYQNKYKSV